MSNKTLHRNSRLPISFMDGLFHFNPFLFAHPLPHLAQLWVSF
jgi:hypothetical protein